MKFEIRDQKGRLSFIVETASLLDKNYSLISIGIIEIPKDFGKQIITTNGLRCCGIIGCVQGLLIHRESEPHRYICNLLDLVIGGCDIQDWIIQSSPCRITQKPIDIRRNP